jgi:hypothetical protein
MNPTVKLLGASMLLAAGCAAPTGDLFRGEEATSTAAHVVSCSGLGASGGVFLKVSGSGVSATVQGNDTYQGEVLASDGDDITFGNFTPAGFFEGSTLVVPRALLDGHDATVQLHSDVGAREGTCHAASAAELGADQCMPLLSDFRPVDSKKKPTVEKTAHGYRIRLANAKTGDFEWLAQTTTEGLLCKLGDVHPTSCAAVVADAIAAQARADGSSSGAPYVDKTAANHWTGSVRDEASGEYAYQVVTKGSADHCQVVAIKLMAE